MMIHSFNIGAPALHPILQQWNLLTNCLPIIRSIVLAFIEAISSSNNRTYSCPINLANSAERTFMEEFVD